MDLILNYKILLILNNMILIENEDSWGTGTRPLDICHVMVYVYFCSKLIAMCGPVFEYSREDFFNDASQEEWDEWEQKAAELELPLDYYLEEFV